MNFKIITIIIVLSSATALLFNYLNPNGIKLIQVFESAEEIKNEDESVSGFYQPIVIDSESAHLLFTKEVRFIDIRTSDDYKNGHIPNSINLPYNNQDKAADILSEYPKETPFVVYGKNTDEKMNRELSEKLFQLEYRRIYIYNGGFEEWTTNNYPVNQ
jgi:rhodanese-related sulfurtransferase